MNNEFVSPINENQDTVHRYVKLRTTCLESVCTLKWSMIKHSGSFHIIIKSYVGGAQYGKQLFVMVHYYGNVA
jgi:hypothetical protein